MMTFQVDIAQRSKERPAWIVLQQVACLNWLLGESPSHPAHIPSSISVTHPLSTLYPRCSHDFLAIVFESTVPPLSHKIKFTTKWFKLFPAANSIGKWQHLELQEEEEVGKGKAMFPMCTICSSLYVTLSLCIAQPSRSATYRMTRLTRGQSQSGPRATVRIGQDVPLLGGKPERQAATQVRAQQLEQSEPSSTKFSHLTISVSQSLLLPPSQQYYNRK